MMNFGSVRGLTIPEGKVKSINRKSDGLLLWKGGYKNWVRYSINADGTIYNNGLGYKPGYRVRSGGAEDVANGVCTGFIPVKSGQVVRISGCKFSVTRKENSINVADSAYSNIGQFTMQPAHYGVISNNIPEYGAASVVEEVAGVWKWVVPPIGEIAFIRVTGLAEADHEAVGAALIVTIDEEVTQ